MANDKKRGTATVRRMTRRLIAKIPTIRNVSRKICPPGQVLRKAHTRHYTTAVRKRGFTVKKATGKSYRVHPTNRNMAINARCVKNTGSKHSAKQQIGPLKKGELAKYGYSFRAAESTRHSALKKAVEEYTALVVYHKLDAVAKLTEHTVPNAAKVFAADREWVHKMIKT